jgi:DNA repair protein RecO (recombination protein O)
MITNAVHAWVIHKSWSGDTSARVIFFTQEHGLLSCFYKGGRSPKKQALLQAFIPLWLVMDVRGDANFVRQLEVAAAPIHLPGQNLFAGLYINELLYHALKPHDPHATLHTAYTLALQALMMASNRFAIEMVLRRFEWELLSSCGYHMSLTHDARSTKPIMAHHFYRFIVGEGFVLAEEGVSGAHLIALSQNKLDDLAVLSMAKQIMRRAIDHALGGKEIKARALYRNE